MTTNPRAKKPYVLPLWSAELGMIAIGLTGIAGIMGWIPTSLERAGSAASASTLAGVVRCADCGVIESIRPVTGKGGSGGIGAIANAEASDSSGKPGAARRGHDITVLLEDGSVRVIRDTNRQAWQPGDRVKVVGNAVRAGR